MGMMGRILGMGPAAVAVGEAVSDVAGAFVGNRAAREAAEAEGFAAVVEASSAEYAQAPQGRFHGWVNGLNRLPRPLLALGTLGLFAYAMAEPAGFGVRMQGLQLVPEPLWWLLGAVVSFYFGARELHYLRDRVPTIRPMATPARLVAAATAAPATAPRPKPRPKAAAADPERNDALEEWRRLHGR